MNTDVDEYAGGGTWNVVEIGFCRVLQNLVKSTESILRRKDKKSELEMKE
jgi:hypothetical protein